MSVYRIPSEFLAKSVKVAVIGAGGTGSAVIACLAQMCLALEALGAPGLEVTVMDDDRVSPANIGRQAFAPCDVGKFKASVLVNRVNQTFGLDWEAVNERLGEKSGINGRIQLPRIFIGCVDTRKARKAIQKSWERAGQHSFDGAAWWLDCGNTAHSGQVILGSLKEGRIELPSAAHLFPEMVDAELDAGDDTPSCSLPEALAKQDLFTNRAIADTAMNLLWKLFRYGETEIHGAFVNLQTMRTNPLPIDPVAWARMGYVAQEDEPETAKATGKKEPATA